VRGKRAVVPILLSILVPVGVILLFVILTVLEVRAAKRRIVEWGERVGLCEIRFGGGQFRLCPMQEGRATRVYHLFATFRGQPVHGWVKCGSGGQIIKAVLSPSLPSSFTANELNAVIDRDSLPGTGILTKQRASPISDPVKIVSDPKDGT
jgi:hypothetical protein